MDLAKLAQSKITTLVTKLQTFSYPPYSSFRYQPVPSAEEESSQIEDTMESIVPVPAPTTSSSKVERKPLSRKMKLFTAGAIFYGNMAFGCSLNTYGPALTTLQYKYDTTDEAISRVFSIMTGSYMVGALCGTFLFNFINRQLAAILLLSTMATMMIITPHIPSMTWFFVSAGVNGICSGSYDVAQFVWMMEMFQSKCPPYVQTQHFSYAVGSIIVTLIMAPFLMSDEEIDNANSTKMATVTPSYFGGNFSYELPSYSLSEIDIAATKDENDDGKRLFIPYTIIGCIVFVAALYQILLFTFLRYHPPPPEVLSEQSESLKPNPEITTEIEKESIFKKLQRKWPLARIRLLFFGCCFYGAYQGMDMCTFQFFSKFAQNSNLGLSESRAARVLTGMTAGYAAGRFTAIIAVFKIPLKLIICANIVLTLVANILLIGWANDSLPVLWASSIIFGLGFSSAFGAFSAFIEKYLIITNFIGAAFIVCASGVAALYPLIIGNQIDENPIVLSYTTFFSIGLMTIAFSALVYITYKDKKKY